MQALPPVEPPLPPRSLRYRRPAVRDLAWLVLDGALPLPPDIDAPPQVRLDGAEEADLLQLLQTWDEDPADAWLGPVDPRLRLGLYAERLIGAWLRQSGRISLLSMNWPLRVERITLGEADFLVRREGRSGSGLQLWELACKFYLGVPGCGWLGPELNDSLASKLARMREFQLQLIHHEGFRAAWHGDWSAQAWLAGWLLAPADSLCSLPPVGIAQAARLPSVWAQAGGPSVEVAEEHARGLGVSEWWLLPKRRWIRPVFADEPVAQRFSGLAEAAALLIAQSGRREAAVAQRRPMMLAGIRWIRLSPAAIASEAMRVMLVPPDWTARAAGGARPGS